MIELKQQVISLKDASGCPLTLCQEAVIYAKGNLQLAKAFLNILTEAKPGLSMEERIRKITNYGAI